MRIIAGKHKGRKLKSTAKMDVRPTTDRTKESIFNIIGPAIVGAKCLDLYAGFGGIGIEALSRGANSVVFIEKNRHNTKIIKENLAMISEDAEVIVNDVLKAIKFLTANFDLIYMDPPYEDEKLYIETLELIRDKELLTPKGIVIIEYDSKGDLKLPNGYDIIKEKKYGKAGITLVRIKERDE